MTKPAYVYVASSWRNPLQDSVVRDLREAGIDCYDFKNPEGRTGFSWSEIDPEWQFWTAEQYIAALDHPAAIAGYDSDFNAMQKADTFVLVLPCGRSAHLELGWAVGMGKRTCIITQDREEPELMAKMVDHIATSTVDMIAWALWGDQKAAAPWPACENHREVQHRDGMSPWCNDCGWNRGRPAVPPMQIAAAR